MVYGQQEFGSLSYGVKGGCEEIYRAWWTLPVIAGDAVTIDWEAQAKGMTLNIYPPATTDFNFAQSDPLVVGGLGDNLKGELTYSAGQTATLPIEFTDNRCTVQPIPGPYSFTAYVVHTVRLSLPRLSKLPRQGILSVAVHYPDGGIVTDPTLLVTLQLRVNGRWLSVGQATVANSVAAVQVTIPARLRHHKITLRAMAASSTYHPVSSASVRAKVL